MNGLIQTLPVVALRGMTVLPDMVIHFDVSREKSIKAIERAMLQEQKVFLVMQQNNQAEDPGQEDLCRIGTIATVKQVIKLPHNILRVLAEGLERAELSRFDQAGECLEAEVICFEKDPDRDWDPGCLEAMSRSILEIFHQYCRESGKVGKELERQISETEEPERLMRQMMIHLPLRYEDKQRFLEAEGLAGQYELVSVLLNHELEIMRFKRELQQKVKKRVDKNQREYFLREQLRVIREELGEDVVPTIIPAGVKSTRRLSFMVSRDVIAANCRIRSFFNVVICFPPFLKDGQQPRVSKGYYMVELRHRLYGRTALLPELTA